jgi:S1-C subfamily serine protease
LKTEAIRMFQVGDVTPSSTLTNQLKRRRTRIELSQTDAGPAPLLDLVRRNRRSVVVLGSLTRCKKCAHQHLSIATGFIMSTSGACVTSYHVIDQPNADTAVAMTIDGTMHRVSRVLAASAEDDLAIVQLDGANWRPLRLGRDAPAGTAVHVISHPDGQLFTVTEGIASRHRAVRRNGRRVTVMEITADFARGSSGAPVLDRRGTVVGVVSNTRSIYASKHEDDKEKLQMVLKRVAPVSALYKLVSN